MHKLESEAERAKVPLEHMTLKHRNDALSFSPALKYIDTR